MENQNPRVLPLWEHSLTTLLGHDPTSDPGIAPRQWVHFQGVHNILDYSVGTKKNSKLFLPNRYTPLMTMVRVYISGPTKLNKCVGLAYMKHVFWAYNSDIDPRNDSFHPFTPDEWSQQTSTMLRTYLIQHLLNPNWPEPVPSGPIRSSRPTGYSPAAVELMGFKKGIKRER